MHDAAIDAGLVERPDRIITDDEYNLAYAEEVRQQVEQMKADRSLSELEEEEEDGEEDEAFIQQLRQKRMEEMRKAKEEKLRRGQEVRRRGEGETNQQREEDSSKSPAASQLTLALLPVLLLFLPLLLQLKEINPFDFEEEVKIPSRQGFVVLLVYRSNHSDSLLLQSILRQFSARHPNLLCVQMHVSMHIANLPPQDCPVLIVYRNEKVVKQFATLSCLAGKETDVSVLEWECAELGMIETQLEEDPRVRIENARKVAMRAQREAEQDEDSDEDY